MIVMPAVDLRGGRTVQLVGGRPGSERVSLPDPLLVAERWVELGFTQLHVVDLDAALGEGSNRPLLLKLVAEAGVPVQVGGGVRGTRLAQELFQGGAARLIVGTRAAEDRAWLTRLCRRWPGRVVVACDVNDGQVVTRGWRSGTGMRAEGLLAGLDDLQLAAVLVTDVSREGRLQGVNADLFAGLVGATRHPLQAAGGIAEIHDLRALRRAGVSAAVLGMSLYTGSIDPAEVIEEFL